MESFMVSALGTVVGLIFAFLFLRLIVGLSSEDTRWHETVATGVFDGRVLAFGFGIAALVAGGFSLAPMARAGSSNPRLAMQMAISAGTSGRTSTTFRNLLTVFQTATSVVLLALLCYSFGLPGTDRELNLTLIRKASRKSIGNYRCAERLRR